MRTNLIAATAFVLVAGTVAASAAAQTETGFIAKIDTKSPAITLTFGTPSEFWLAKGINVSMLKVGEKVAVTYDMVNGKATASAVVMESNRSFFDVM